MNNITMLKKRGKKITEITVENRILTGFFMT